MPRRLCLEWPDPAPFRDRDGAPIRILAVSDQIEHSLDDRRTREAIGRIDLIVGCGDLDACELGFVADSVDAPLVFIRGNHDGDERWKAEAEEIPPPITMGRELGIAIAGLSWPGTMGPRAKRSEFTAWRQAVGVAARRLVRAGPLLVVSHAPPRGAGDVATDPYHRGFAGYGWLLDRVRPPIWLHGHTPLAAVPEWHAGHGPTTLVNVTGAVILELEPPRR